MPELNTQPIDFPIDRVRGMVRGLWRLGAGGLFALPLIVSQPDWHLLWLTQRASFLGLAMLFLFLGLVAAGLAISAGAWLLFAAWPKELAIHLDGRGLHARLGPYGNRDYDAARLRIDVDESIDRSLIDLMPDDAFVPRMIHPVSDEDLTRKILRFTRIDQETLTRLLRPYMHATSADDAQKNAHASE